MRLIRSIILLGVMPLAVWSTIVACGSDDDVADRTEATSTPDAAGVQPPATPDDGSAAADGMPPADGGVISRTPPGTLDPTFGIQGKVTIDFAGYDDEAHAIARAANGTLVVAGSGGGVPSRFALARLQIDGSLDPTFGDGGRVTTAFHRPDGSPGRASADALALYPDGRILAAGHAHVNPSGVIFVATPDGGMANDDLVFARYLPNGALDETFGVGGVVRLSASAGQDHVRGLVILSDGKILATGVQQFLPEINKLLVTRLLPDGELDTTFGTNGSFVYTHPSDSGRNTDQLGHAIVLAGSASSPSIVVGGALRPGGGVLHAMAARLDVSGALDPSFGTGGLTLARFETESKISYAYAVAAGVDGSVYLGGVSGSNPSVIKTTPTGAIDMTFGTAGIARGLVAAKGVGYALVLAGSRPVLGGAAVNGSSVVPILHRFSPSGVPDSTFAGGAPTFDVSGIGGITALAVDGDYSIVAAGSVTRVPAMSTKSDMLVMRIGN